MVGGVNTAAGQEQDARSNRVGPSVWPQTDEDVGGPGHVTPLCES